MTSVAMSPLVQVKQHNTALLFSHYLSSINIKADVVRHEDHYLIVCQSDKFEQAKAEFTRFIEQPNHQKYQQAAWQTGEVSRVNADHPALFSSVKEQFLSHAGLVTLTIFTFCWLIFLATNIGWGREIFQAIHFYPQLSLTELIQQPQRLIGPVFFHFSWMHIIFNTLWWWQLGGDIERILGKSALFNVFLISAIVSNLGQYLVSGPNFGGLSGVVYGLVGYVWWLGWLAPEKGLLLSKPLIGLLLFWLLLGFAEVLPVNMANTAHLLGLVSGCLLALLNVKLTKNWRLFR